MALLDESAIDNGLAGLDGWDREKDSITRTFEFPDFSVAIVFVNMVADIAEEAQHHPDIDIRWNKVRLDLSSHSEGGLTQADFDVAAKIDKGTPG